MERLLCVRFGIIKEVTYILVCFFVCLFLFFSSKVWDLRAGRLLSELREHTASVTEVVFHPHEFLLASGGADRRVLFWDLENFTLVSNSEPETSGIRFVSLSLLFCFPHFLFRSHPSLYAIMTVVVSPLVVFFYTQIHLFSSGGQVPIQRCPGRPPGLRLGALPHLGLCPSTLGSHSGHCGHGQSIGWFPFVNF